MSEKKNPTDEIPDTKELKELGEVQKFQFDYFKLMTTLTMAFITALVALVKGIFEAPRVSFLIAPAFIILILSLLCSLVTLVTIGNIILWMKGIPIYLRTKQEKKAKKLAKRIMDAFDSFGVLQGVTIYSFFLGVLILLVFTAWNFLG